MSEWLDEVNMNLQPSKAKTTHRFSILQWSPESIEDNKVLMGSVVPFLVLLMKSLDYRLLKQETTF